MKTATQSLTAESLGIDFSSLPVLLDEDSIRQRVAPIGKTTLYAAATRGEIETVLLGAPGKRGKRLFLTSSVVAWIIRRANVTARPPIGSRKAVAKAVGA